MRDSLLIRGEQPGDAAAVRSIHRLAFGQDDEAALVDRLRDSCPERLSLVAEQAGRPVGHILFTPVRVEGPAAGTAAPFGMGLAPVAVLPETQRRGVGGALIRRGLEELAAGGCAYVVVLGHSEYYPRFGFRPSLRFDLACPYDGVPEEAFMALELVPGALDGVAGRVRYRPEVDQAT